MILRANPDRIVLLTPITPSLLTGAKDALTQSRVLIHGFVLGELEKAIEPGLEVAARGQKAGEDALAEWSFRRKGLGVSLFFILFLAAVIYLKIRRIERTQAS